MEMSLHISLPLIPFEKWRIDYVGEVHSNSSRGMAYIVVAIEYLTKWTHAATVMYENIIFRFGCSKTLVSDRGTHFLNDPISDMINRF